MATHNRLDESRGRDARRRLTRAARVVADGVTARRRDARGPLVARRLALALAVLLLAPTPTPAQSGRRQPGAQPTPTPQRPRRAPATTQDPQPGQPSTPDAPSTTTAPRPVPTPADANPATDPALEDDEVYKVESNLVPVSANVSDTATGRAVVDLKVEDFELRVDGQPKPISDISFSETPVRLALLFDNSSSIRPTRELEKHAAAGFFRKVMRPVDQGAVFSIATYPTLDQQLTSDVAKLARTIENYGDVENSTALFDTIVMAAEYLQPLPGRKVIVIVSDGVETTSRLTDFGEVVRRALAADCQIFVIQTGLSDNANLRDLMAERRMADLTASTGGAVFTPKLAADLEGAFAQISNDLRQQYVLSYYPNDDGRDGRFRSIALRVKTRPNMRVRARRGYYPRRRPGDVSTVTQSSADTASTVNEPESHATIEAAKPPAPALPEAASTMRAAASQPARGSVGGSKNMDYDGGGETSRPGPAAQNTQPAVRLGNFKPRPVESPANNAAADSAVNSNTERPPPDASRAPATSPSTAHAATDSPLESKRESGATAPSENVAADTSRQAPTPQPDTAKQTTPETSNRLPATRTRTAQPRDGRAPQTEQASAQQKRPAESNAERGGEKSPQGEGPKSDAPARKVPVSGGVLNGRALSLPLPAYPEHAVRMRAGGKVTVEVTIDEGGNVIAARAVSGHALLRDAAVAAARRARFSPTLISGQPVQVAGVINYNFTI